MKARWYQAPDQHLWDDMVGRSRSNHFMFRRGYMEYHAGRFTDASMMVEDADSGKLAAVFPASRHGDEIVSHGGLTFGGVVSDTKAAASRTLEIFEAIRALAAPDFSTLRYKAVPHIYHDVPAEEDLYALFRAGARLVRRDIASSIYLDRRLKYGKGRRWSLKRAQALKDVTVARSNDFAAFLAVEAQALARHDATAVHSADELQTLAERFPQNITLTVAEREGRMLGGVVVYSTPITAHAQYIGATDEGKELGVLDLVIDQLITEAADGLRWFDFGISTEEAGQHLNPGLVANKESYGARGIAYDHYEVTLAKRG